MIIADVLRLRKKLIQGSTQQDAWKLKQPILGERVNPLTGEAEPRDPEKLRL